MRRGRFTVSDLRDVGIGNTQVSVRLKCLSNVRFAMN
jgi:hypothetical protein